MENVQRQSGLETGHLRLNQDDEFIADVVARKTVCDLDPVRLASSFSERDGDLRDYRKSLSFGEIDSRSITNHFGRDSGCQYALGEVLRDDRASPNDDAGLNRHPRHDEATPRKPDVVLDGDRPVGDGIAVEFGKPHSVREEVTPTANSDISSKSDGTCYVHIAMRENPAGRPEVEVASRICGVSRDLDPTADSALTPHRETVGIHSAEVQDCRALSHLQCVHTDDIEHADTSAVLHLEPLGEHNGAESNANTAAESRPSKTKNPQFERTREYGCNHRDESPH